MEILCLGNPRIEEDSIGPYVAERLKIKGVTFRHCPDAGEFERIAEKGKELVIIDSAAGIDKITVIDDVSMLVQRPRYSLHDYDISFSIRLMKEMGTLPKVKIIAVPKKMPKKEVMEALPGIIAGL